MQLFFKIVCASIHAGVVFLHQTIADLVDQAEGTDRWRSRTDRRVVEVALIAQGDAAARRLPALIDAGLCEQLRDSSVDDVATLVGLLRRFIATDPGSVPVWPKRGRRRGRPGKTAGDRREAADRPAATARFYLSRQTVLEHGTAAGGSAAVYCRNKIFEATNGR